MAKQTNFVRTQIRLPVSVNQSLEEFADRYNLSKNEAMIYLISKGIESMAESEKMLEDGPFMGLLKKYTEK